jgi:uncharacterized protein DUF3892
MATFLIDQVHLEQAYGATHPHIARVHLTNGEDISRARVIFNIEQSRNTFYSHKPGVADAKVIVTSCPYCGSGDYITTEPDYTPNNNLLHLPKY